MATATTPGAVPDRGGRCCEPMNMAQGTSTSIRATRTVRSISTSSWNSSSRPSPIVRVRSSMPGTWTSCSACASDDCTWHARAHREARRRHQRDRHRDQSIHHRAHCQGAGCAEADRDRRRGATRWHLYRQASRHAHFPRRQDRRGERVLASTGHRLSDYESWFYSDSLNDLPLLELVTHPVAVDPDPTLRARAEERGWRIMSLR